MNSPRARVLLACITLVSLSWLPQLYATPVFINEIHYDNAGGDRNEAVEIAGIAGTDLSAWYLHFYNGGNGSVYATLELGGVIPNLEAGHGVLAFPIAGIQNGAPDGIALESAGNTLIQFLSYEGVFQANTGVAAGVVSSLIGVAESGTTQPSESLHLVGDGSGYGDFQWQAGASSFGTINPGQRFPLSTGSVPAPAGWLLCLTGLVLLARNRRRLEGGHNGAPLGRPFNC